MAASQGRRFPVKGLSAFVLFFVSAVLLQLNAGAYQGEFGNTADEAAHFVTGLMVRDYVATGAPWPPIEYAENYYRHYPKVAIGHFPPGFYVVQGAWNLVFPPSRISVMLLMALISALLATCIHGVVCAQYTYWGGIATGLVWLSLPFNQTMGRAVMADIFVALLALLATLAWSRYLQRGHVRDSIQFGVFASIALLTKGTAIALAVVALVSTLLSGKFRLAGRWSFWLPAVMVIVLCGPWYLLAPGAIRAASNLGDLKQRGPLSPLIVASRALWLNFGIVLLTLVAVGFWIRIVYPLLKKRSVQELWACLAALAISLPIVAIWIIPARGSRHVLFGLPACSLFLAAGVAGVLSFWPRRHLSRAARTAIIALAATVLVAYNVVRVQPVDARGFSAAADEILAQRSNAKSILLISSDGPGEGALVSEIARREPVRPAHVVLRASGLLARDSFSGIIYSLRFKSTEELAALLRRIPVEFVILDHAANPIYPHQRLLAELMAQSPDSWERFGEYTDSEGKPSIEVFRQLDVRKFAGTPIELDEIPGLETIHAR